MALELEIEFLSGVSFAAFGPDSDAPDWPPQPDRVFSALVATWGAHGQPHVERLALEWLEGLSVPACAHGGAAARSAPTAFVPPNDPSVHRASALRVLPALRNRQPRRFPAATPRDPVVRHYWPDDPDDATLIALDRLARDTSYIGHSASLTRCRFLRSALRPGEAPTQATHRIYSGRLQELCSAHARFERSADKKDRPAKGAPVLREEPPRALRRNVFSDRWLVLEHVGAEHMPDLRAAALVARGVRIALMSGYGQLGLPVPPQVSGHAPDGSPSTKPHLAVVPLAFTGFAHADGRVLGFGVVPPTHSGLLDDADLMKVLRHLAPLSGPGRERRELTVKTPEGTAPDQAFAVRLAPSFEAPMGRLSLDPALHTAPAHRWATVTPIALDRHPKASRAARLAEMAALVATACVRIGLPEPVAVRIDKHSAFEGAPSAYPSGDAPAWMRWRLPESLAGRALTHAVVEFAEPVPGPLLLGAGRFVGLGLCRPLDTRRR